jgi:hypothetical protein
MSEHQPVSIKSEFAHVTVALDDRANGPRLLITDQLAGRQRYVDPLELECLTRAEPGVLDRYLPYEEDFLEAPTWLR